MGKDFVSIICLTSLFSSVKQVGEKKMFLFFTPIFTEKAEKENGFSIAKFFSALLFPRRKTKKSYSVRNDPGKKVYFRPAFSHLLRRVSGRMSIQIND